MFGGKVLEKEGNWVEPCVIEIDRNNKMLDDEYFVPILFVSKFKTLEEAIHTNNKVE